MQYITQITADDALNMQYIAQITADDTISFIALHDDKLRHSKNSGQLTICVNKLYTSTNTSLVNLLQLTHSFPMHPFSTPRKHQKTLRFSNVFRR